MRDATPGGFSRQLGSLRLPNMSFDEPSRMCMHRPPKPPPTFPTQPGAVGGRADQSAPSSTLWNARVKEAAVAQGILFNFAGSNTCFYNNSLHPEADSDTCALTCSSHTTSSRHRTTRCIHFATAKEGNSANVFLVWRRDARMCRENWLRIAPRLQSETCGRNTRARMGLLGRKVGEPSKGSRQESAKSITSRCSR